MRGKIRNVSALRPVSQSLFTLVAVLQLEDPQA